MKVLDNIGGELAELDAVAIDVPLVIGTIVKIDSGEIARGLVLDGQPKGQILPPHIVVKVELTVPLLIQAPQGSPVGQVPGVVKVVKPEAK
jgi:hypothetical protein